MSTRITTPRYDDIAPAAAAMILQESQSFVGPTDQGRSQHPVWQSQAMWITDGAAWMRLRPSTVPQHGIDLI